MAPKYKLSYFDVKALAEPIRLLFHYANVEFEDVRVAKEDWPNLKPQMPWNVMPVLEEDGKQLCQSVVIFRYLGRKFGLAPHDEFLTAKCDEYVDVAFDARLEVFKTFKEEDAAKKAEGMKNLKETNLPRIWKKFNDILKQNGTGVLVGKEITYADIFVAFYTEYLSAFVSVDCSDFPELVALQKKIFEQPGIKQWIAKRPATQF